MKPENVNPANFEVKDILFDNEDFSVAYGTWKDGNSCIAMRWNGGTDKDAGYPKTFGHPMWFMIEEELQLPFVRSLIGLTNSKHEALLKTLAKIL